MQMEKIEMDTGKVKIRMDVAQNYYYETLSEMTDVEIGRRIQDMNLVTPKRAKRK